jgi:heme d1 biosynthesis radical SAM protein NirJ
MFRITAYNRLILGNGASNDASARPSGQEGSRVDPIIIWNLTRTCNLECVHCYASSKSKDYKGELTTKQAFDVVDQLKEAGCGTIVFSGGEPLFREDLFEIGSYAKEKGFFTALSSNGTMIGDIEAEKLRTAGFDYIGISLDGIGQVHDNFRGMDGAFELAVAGILRCKEKGLRIGVRFTITKRNSHHLPLMFDFVEEKRIAKIYISHLVYSGRGVSNSEEALGPEETRKAVRFIMEKAAEYVKNDIPIEVVTGNNDADAVYFLQELFNNDPAAAEKLVPLLEKWGGNNAGIGVANIDPRGEVHPDPLMSDLNLGNVKTGRFKKIWYESEDEFLLKLRKRPRILNGRCGRCEWIKICGGNSRTRAIRSTGDPMASDPACYLYDEEVLSQKAGVSIS